MNYADSVTYYLGWLPKLTEKEIAFGAPKGMPERKAASRSLNEIGSSTGRLSSA